MARRLDRPEHDIKSWSSWARGPGVLFLLTSTRTQVSGMEKQ
jgi:hypothetical protein